MSKYKREEKARYDKKQTILAVDGYNPNAKRYATITITDYYDKIVICPFCLGEYKLTKFLVSTKKGYDERDGKCPECKRGMTLKTLINMTVWTPEQYAEFAFPYAQSGFWQKVSWEKWKTRIRPSAQQFWNRYRELKGEKTESYTEYMERKSLEDQQEYDAQQHEE